MARFVLMLFILTIFNISCSRREPSYAAYNVTHFIEPRIGGAADQPTNPGAAVPDGWVTIAPITSAKNAPGKDRTGLYHYGDPFVSDLALCDPLDQPLLTMFTVLGEKPVVPTLHMSAYDLEFAAPGYYKVMLEESRTFIETTATPRTGFTRFHFQDGFANLIVSTTSPDTHDENAFISMVNPLEMEGYTFRQIREGGRQKIYFVIKMDRPAMKGWMFSGEKYLPEQVYEVRGNKIGRCMSFRTREASTISVKTAVSAISIENARHFLLQEQGSWSFELIRERALAEWEKRLTPLRVYGGDTLSMRLFHTALYHTCIQQQKMAAIKTPDEWSRSDRPLIETLMNGYCSALAEQLPVPALDSSSDYGMNAIKTHQLMRQMLALAGEQPERLQIADLYFPWLSLAMIGLHPDCRGDGTMVAGIPLFPRIEYSDNSHQLIIDVDRPSPAVHAVRSIVWNGAEQKTKSLPSQIWEQGGSVKIKIK